MTKENSATETYRPSLLKSISLSIKVLVSEIHWNIIKGLRKWEIKELKKRLDREYLTLGKLTFHLNEKDDEQKSQVELTKQQIEFLEKEIKSLENELVNLREQIIKNRSGDL
jgi:cob(I)alamin adenosyltransferase